MCSGHPGAEARRATVAIEARMIAVESLHHVGICVTDLARAKQFYSEVLGLREIPRPPFDFGGAWYQLGDGELHLIVHPATRTLRGTRDIDARDGHLAIRVRSYDETLQHLRSHGIECLERRRNVTPWAQIYVTDPDGNVVEFNADEQ
jgi:catechol 2,3-dioxygenase-like lactoylglutathione lyase family enzyme